MRKKIVSGIFALIGLGSIAVLGVSPQYIGGLIEYIHNSAFGNALGSVNSYQSYDPGVRSVGDVASFLKTNENVNLRTIEIPEETLWRVIFSFPERFKTAAEKARATGQDDSPVYRIFYETGKIIT